jgi:hypothetical protein
VAEAEVVAVLREQVRPYASLAQVDHAGKHGGGAVNRLGAIWVMSGSRLIPSAGKPQHRARKPGERPEIWLDRPRSPPSVPVASTSSASSGRCASTGESRTAPATGTMRSPGSAGRPVPQGYVRAASAQGAGREELTPGLSRIAQWSSVG